jgi:hypothetical protein
MRNAYNAALWFALLFGLAYVWTPSLRTVAIVVAAGTTTAVLRSTRRPAL